MKRSSLFAFAMFAAFSFGFLPAKSLHASACDNPGDCKGTTEEATPPPAPSTSASGCWKPGGNNCQLIQESCVCQQEPTTTPPDAVDDYGFLCITTEQCQVGVITTVNSKRVCTFQHDPACDLGPSGTPTSPTAPEPSSPSTPIVTPTAPTSPATPTAPTAPATPATPVSDPTVGTNAPADPVYLPAPTPSPTLPPTNEDPTDCTHGSQPSDNGGGDTSSAGDCSDGVIVLGQCHPKEFLFIKGGGGTGCTLVANGASSGSETPIAALLVASCTLLLIAKSRNVRRGR